MVMERCLYDSDCISLFNLIPFYVRTSVACSRIERKKDKDQLEVFPKIPRASWNMDPDSEAWARSRRGGVVIRKAGVKDTCACACVCDDPDCERENDE